MNYRNGIAWDSELKQYQEKAKNWDKAIALRLERAKLKTRLHQIGQEEAKLYGVTEKYG